MNVFGKKQTLKEFRNNCNKNSKNEEFLDYLDSYLSSNKTYFNDEFKKQVALDSVFDDSSSFNSFIDLGSKLYFNYQEIKSEANSLKLLLDTYLGFADYLSNKNTVDSITRGQFSDVLEQISSYTTKK